MPSPPRASFQNPYGPQVSFRTEDVLPPTAFYLSLDDTLLTQVLTSGTGLTFTVTVRMLRPDGTLTVDNYQTTPSVFNGAIYYAIIPPVEGYVLSCMVQGGGTIDGSCFCTVIAYRGTVTLPITVFPPVAGIVLIQGYVDSWTNLSWPQSPIVEAGMGAGRMRNIMPTVAAGQNWQIKTGAAQRWDVIAATCALTTSAVAANRTMALMPFDRFGNGMNRFPCNFTQPASTTLNYYFYQGAAHVQTGGSWITAPFPTGITLDPGMSVQSRVQNLDAGDSWSFVNCLVREWMGVGHS